jgi:hypothetical protein
MIFFLQYDDGRNINMFWRINVLLGNDHYENNATSRC